MLYADFILLTSVGSSATTFFTFWAALTNSILTSSIYGLMANFLVDPFLPHL